MKFTTWFICCLAFFFNPALSQQCACSDLVREIIQKTESDYAGYIHKVKETDTVKYTQFKNSLLSEAAGSTFENCYQLLEKYVEFFNDGHLYVVEFPDRQNPKLAVTARKFPLPENDESLLITKKDLDPVEGIWNGGDSLQLRIIKYQPNKFYGVIRHSNAPNWERGMIKIEIEKTGDNEYSLAYYRNDFANIHFTKVYIDKRVFLSFGVYRFAKIVPADPEIRYINTSNPPMPVFQTIDRENILLTVPSALIDGRYLDSLLMAHEKEIRSTPNLIIDIRGNGGGNYIWGGIYEIANTVVKPKWKDPKEDDFLMLASEDDADYFYNQGAYYRKQNDSAGIRYYDNLVNRIRQNIGKIIGVSWYNPAPDTATRQVFPFPKRIAVLIDKGVASAGEAFVMGLRETSSRVTLYGNNTHGMIDYMNVNTIPLSCDSTRWYYFGYPTIFSKEIKTKPVNPTGIIPDIRIPEGTADAIQWVIADLRKRAGLQKNK